jgi:hypothetical protein
LDGTHIDGATRHLHLLEIGTFDRSIGGPHPLDNHDRERTPPRHTSGELL